MSGFWEPWRPEIGQKVRVNVSPECRTHYAGTDAHLIKIVNGRTGVVSEWPEWVKAKVGIFDDHPYLVRLDEPIAEEPHWAVCAAIELEPVH